MCACASLEVRLLLLTLQEFGVDKELQGEENHHQDDTGHQEAVKARTQQTHLPQSSSPPTARLQPVRPEETHTHTHTHTGQLGIKGANASSSLPV